MSLSISRSELAALIIAGALFVNGAHLRNQLYARIDIIVVICLLVGLVGALLVAWHFLVSPLDSIELIIKLGSLIAVVGFVPDSHLQLASVALALILIVSFETTSIQTQYIMKGSKHTDLQRAKDKMQTAGPYNKTIDKQ